MEEIPLGSGVGARILVNLGITRGLLLPVIEGLVAGDLGYSLTSSGLWIPTVKILPTLFKYGLIFISGSLPFSTKKPCFLSHGCIGISFFIVSSQDFIYYHLGKIMTPQGITYNSVIESQDADYAIAPEIVEVGTFPSRKSSTLAKRGVASNTAVHELLECPICMNVMCPPIHQCPNGHTLCLNCKSNVRCCPICRHELGNIRCLALEKIAQSLELPCSYKILGCQDTFPYRSRLRHEQDCRYRPYNCPYAGEECLVTGDIRFLVAHLKNDHKVDMHDGCTFKHRYVKTKPKDVDNAIWMLTIFNCFGFQFCLHFEALNLGTAPVYMAFIRFMGDDQDAKKFNYSLEVGGNGRKLTWYGVPRSIRDSYTTVRDSLDGLIIQRNMALFFSGGNKQELKLKISGRIWKEQS